MKSLPSLAVLTNSYWAQQFDHYVLKYYLKCIMKHVRYRVEKGRGFLHSMCYICEYKEQGRVDRCLSRCCTHVTYLVAMTSNGRTTNHSITSIPEPEDGFILRIAAILSPEMTEITKQRETKAVHKETRVSSTKVSFNKRSEVIQSSAYWKKYVEHILMVGPSVL